MIIVAVNMHIAKFLFSIGPKVWKQFQILQRIRNL